MTRVYRPELIERISKLPIDDSRPVSDCWLLQLYYRFGRFPTLVGGRKPSTYILLFAFPPRNGTRSSSTRGGGGNELCVSDLFFLFQSYRLKYNILVIQYYYIINNTHRSSHYFVYCTFFLFPESIDVIINTVSEAFRLNYRNVYARFCRVTRERNDSKQQ